VEGVFEYAHLLYIEQTKKTKTMKTLKHKSYNSVQPKGLAPAHC